MSTRATDSRFIERMILDSSQGVRCKPIRIVVGLLLVCGQAYPTTTTPLEILRAFLEPNRADEKQNDRSASLRLQESAALDIRVDVKARGGSEKEDLRWTRRQQGRLDFAFVLLPDPHRTRTPLAFDRGLESVQRAAEDSGYVIDQHWLPCGTSFRWNS